ncbi:DUF1816 domain-containing protein (plasmid) [Nostoc sp. ATCC 53789]|nr:DUF1816 domain-containing protein [Nostoc sp. ATCC 53789]
MYYFGPFQSFVEAKAACPGYVDDHNCCNNSKIF